MNYNNYFKKIGLSNNVIDKVTSLIESNQEQYNKYIDGLVDRNTAESTFLKIKEDYPNDEKSFIILSIYLLASIKTLELYKQKRISKKIFYDTIKCISRFINECIVMNNEEYFDRDFWAYRQLSLKIFRLGVLEYEFMEDFSISIHIPSDAVLTKKNIDKSLKLLKKFIIKYFPNYKDKLMYCDSWLLSPELKKYLNNDSKILLFQSYFEIKEVNKEDKGFIGWLYQTNNKEDINALREDTSLQRKVKNALLNNENIGSAYGILK